MNTTVALTFNVDMDVKELHHQCWSADDISVEENADLHHLSMFTRDTYVRVVITFDDGETQEGTTTLNTIHKSMIRKALSMGWTMSGKEDGVWAVDLGQFDPWDVSGCVQEAAFGEIVVG